MENPPKKLTVLHFADCHLRDDDQLPERQACLEHIVGYAQKSRPDIIICAGDVFDSQHVRLDSMSAKVAFQVFSDLSSIAPVFVIAGTPSHEGNATEVFNKIGGAHPIHVATRPEQKVVENSHGRLAVVTCLPAFTKQYLYSVEGVEGGDLAAAGMIGQIMAGFGIQAAEINLPHIVVGHAQVKGSMVSDTQVLTGVDIEIPADSFELAHADLVCMGHIHKAQRIGETAIFYSGSTQAENWGELDDKGFWAHSINIDCDGVVSEFVPTPSIKRLRIPIDLTDGDGLENLELRLYKNVHAKDLVGVKIRVEAKVYVDQADAIDVDMIKGSFIASGAISCDVIRIRIPRTQIRSSNLVELESLRDRIEERARLVGDTILDPAILKKADLLEMDPGGITEHLALGLEYSAKGGDVDE